MTGKKTSVLIIGAGEFGASTALSLLKTGNYTVTMIDRAPVLPAMDAASTDINKVVRWDYSDKDYARLAREAIDVWKKEFPGIYYESGMVVRGLHNDGIDGANARTTYENVKHEPGVTYLDTPEKIRSHLATAQNLSVADIPEAERSYFNPVGGWAWAAKAVEKLYERIIPLGGEIIHSAELDELIIEDGDVRGAKVKDGREWRADKTLVCTGSWTAAHPALRGLMPEGLITATGQCIAAVQLDAEEMEKYKDIPVTFHYDGTGYYSFPPTPTGLIKFAIHGAGYTWETGVPRTALDMEAQSYHELKQVAWIPSEMLQKLREQLALVYPELAKKPVAYTRMCWYSDVVDGDWVIDYTKYPSLLVAAGGSGHAFKFLPIMGDLIRARLENTLEEHLVQKWRIDRTPAAQDPQRTGMARKPLDLNALATNSELSFAKL